MPVRRPPAGRAAGAEAAPRGRVGRPARKATGKPSSKPASRAGGGGVDGGRRWLGIAAIVAAVLVGLPLAHAVLGELGALALALVLAGFALGRSTARGG